MKHLKRILIGTAVLASALYLLPVEGRVLAQGADIYGKAMAAILNAEPVNANITAVDTDVAVIVRALHTTAATVQAAATSLLFTSDGTSGTGQPTCPSSGTAGTIDETNASCNTLGLVVDAINANANWRAVILDGLRADSSNGVFAILAATAARDVRGVNLKWSTGAANNLRITQALTPYRDMTFYISQPGNKLIPDPYAGQRGLFMKGHATVTYATGTSNFEVHSVRATVNPISGVGTETDTLLWKEAGGATATDKTFDFTQYGMATKKNDKLVIRVVNSAALSAPTFFGYGITLRYN